MLGPSMAQIRSGEGERRVGRHVTTPWMTVVTILVLLFVAGELPSPVSASSAGWGTPVPLVSTDLTASEPLVVVDGKGNTVVVWKNQLDDNRWSLWASRFTPDLGWGAPTRVDQGFVGEMALAVDASGNIFLVWVGSGAIFAARFVPGLGWTSPQAIGGPLVAAWGTSYSYPQLAAAEDGTAIAVWVAIDRWLEPDLILIQANYYVPDAGWGGAVTLAGGAPSLRPVALDMDAQGNAILIWEGEGLWANRYVAGEGWEPPVILADNAWQGDLAMTPSGEAVAVWSNGSGLYASKFVPTFGWGPAQKNEGMDSVAYPQVEIDAMGNAVAIWEGWIGSSRDALSHVMASRLTSGAGWDLVTPVSKGNFVGDLAMNAEGYAIAVWRPAGLWYHGEAEVLASRYTPGVGWASASIIGTSRNGAAPKVAIDSSHSSIAVWRSGGIWYNRYVSPESAIDQLARDLEESLGGLADVQDDLSETRDDLAATQNALDAANSALADTNAKIVSLLLLQGVFVASTVVLFVLYRRPPLEGLRTLREVAGRVRSRRSPSGPEKMARHWPLTPPGDPLRLITKERILLHLLHVGNNSRGPAATMEQTQQGIAHGVRSDLRHLGQYLRPLVQGGLITERTRRVEGGLQRMKVYALTGDGRGRASGIRERVLSATVRVRNANGIHDARLADVLDQGTISASLLEIVYETFQKGIVDLGTEGQS